ncbi:GNAT family N-acetyltransferase [Candidatus Gottesmanbacteria bacterium]|nr:GNAT family N-acetyltransferase [Candidatus Gottesmanbacteria bacterium]
MAELKRFYIDKNYRGKGYGSQLVDKAIEFCRNNKFHKIILDTWSNFSIASKMYKKRGFKLIKEDKITDCRCNIFMEKLL